MQPEKTIWDVKKVPTYPKEWKVYPVNRNENWDTNEPDRYHSTWDEAYEDALKRNQEWQ